jgi:YesN/AraC family two-component response regulator
VSELFANGFLIHRYAGHFSLDSEIEGVKPAVICFDFDFPTKMGLKLLQRTKQSHPRIPLLMLTVQHSEALAVWAFRSRVWDYLVKPVAKVEMERCIVGLHEMLQMQALQKESRSPALVKALIPEENRTHGIRDNATLQLAGAIEYVERNFREKISSSEVASLCGLTPFQFSRTFKETYGLTFQEYVLRYRIREACRLLKNPAAEVAEVAHLAGFNDPSYFGKIFRRYISCSPSQYQAAKEPVIDPGLLEDLIGQSAHSET